MTRSPLLLCLFLLALPGAAGAQTQDFSASSIATSNWPTAYLRTPDGDLYGASQDEVDLAKARLTCEKYDGHGASFPEHAASLTIGGPDPRHSFPSFATDCYGIQRKWEASKIGKIFAAQEARDLEFVKKVAGEK